MVNGKMTQAKVGCLTAISADEASTYLRSTYKSSVHGVQRV